MYHCGRKTSVFSPLDFMEKRTSDTNTCINMNHMIVEFPLHQLMDHLFSGSLHWFGHLCSGSRAKSE